MIEIYLKYDYIHIFEMINAFNCINNHVILCINSMLLGGRFINFGFDFPKNPPADSFRRVLLPTVFPASSLAPRPKGNALFEIKFLGKMRCFLGIEVAYSNQGIFIS